MSHLGFCVVLLGWALAADALEPGFDGRHRATAGDLNGDGRKDIWLRHQPIEFPADADGTTLIPLPSQVQEFVLQQTNTGGYTLVTGLSLAHKTAVRSWPVQPAIRVDTHDYNADGVRDVLILDVGAAIPGAKDVLVYAGLSTNAAPQGIRVIDGPLQSFMTDVQGFLEDNSYYDSGVYVQCTVQYLWVWVYYVEYGWVTELWPYLVCQYAFDPTGFSLDAFEFLNYLTPFLNGMQLVAGNENAINLDRVFREVFGVEVLRGVLADNGNDDTDGDCWAAYPCVRYQRFARLLDILARLDKETIDFCAPGDAHHYTAETPICTVGNTPNCVIADVYKEQLAHPAPGYERNIVPVKNNQRGYAEFFIPGPAGNLGDIIFRVDLPNLRHTNETLETHVLYPGEVVRQTIVQSNLARILTDGHGNGGCKVLNEYIGKGYFKALDFYIQGHVVGGHSGIHPAPEP